MPVKTGYQLALMYSLFVEDSAHISSPADNRYGKRHTEKDGVHYANIIVAVSDFCKGLHEFLYIEVEDCRRST